MERFYKKISPIVESSSSSVDIPVIQPQESSSQASVKVDLENLLSDPGLRPNIMDYSPNIIEQVRRAYLLKGPCQPRKHNFPQNNDGNRKRKFVESWFDEFKDWLEYSITKDAAFCLYCYLFSTGCSERGHDAFVSEGFSNWRKKERLREHVGDHSSVHNKCRLACQNLMDLNDRFNEVNSEMLLSMACLDPRDSFSAFDKKKLLRLAQFYPSEFSEVDLYELENQLENFLFDVRLDRNFSEVVGIGGLAQKMVATRKHVVFPLVYLLVKLSLILPVATATVERAFSAMKIVKSSLRNRMGDKLLNDCLIAYIEKDVFENVSNEAIMERFQNMKNRREML